MIAILNLGSHATDPGVFSDDALGRMALIYRTIGANGIGDRVWVSVPDGSTDSDIGAALRKEWLDLYGTEP